MRIAAWVVLLLMPVSCVPQSTGKGAWIFAYFKDPGKQGFFLAMSRDGLHYTDLNGGKPWMTPVQDDELFRDIFITRTPAGFRAVWTWNWESNSIGTAESKDLLTWTPQQKVPLMKDFPTVRNTWAPEVYWDAKAKDWMLLWSSSLNAKPGDKYGTDLRLWSAHTKDFSTFTKPAVFFERGFPVIDGTMFQRGKNDVVMVLKDQTKEPLKYNERWVSGPTVEGPWSELSGEINETWSEGPSVVRLGDRDVIFYDHYREPGIHYEAIATRDWKTWTNITDEISMPEKSKHGSFFWVNEGELRKLMGRMD